MAEAAQIGEMSPVTRLLFLEIGPDRCGKKLARQMEDLGADLTLASGAGYRFRYEDGGEISGYIYVSDGGEVSSISLALGLESDRLGWEGWSEKNEALRLRKQDEWLKARSLGNRGPGHGRILNHYSPQSDGSEIAISFGD